MEIHVDELNDRVFIGHDRGSYIVVERDGSTGTSFLPRNAMLVFDRDGGAFEDGYEAGYAAASHKAAPAEAS